MPGKAKKKTAKKRSGASKKRAKSTAKSKPKKPAAKAKKKTAKAKPKPAAFGTGRRSTNREIRERREWVSRLYIVRRWKLLQILPKYEEQFGCGLETLKKDITEIRKQFKDAKKKGEGSLDEILHEITEGKDERKRILWNELAKIDEGEKLLSARREMYEKRLDLPDQDYVSIGKIIADIDKQLVSVSPRSLSWLKSCVNMMTHFQILFANWELQPS